MNLKKLIREVLEGKECCTATKPTKAPILNESLAPREILSEGLQYHIDNKKPLTEHLYRAGSTNYFNLWAEARSLYTRGILDFSGDDLAILTETNLGEFGIYEGKKVPLDFIMEEENYYQDIINDIKTYGKIYESVNIENSYPIDNIESDEASNSFVFTDKHGIQRKLSYFKGGSIKLLWLNPSTNEWTTEKIPSKYEDEKVMNTFGKILVKIILPKYKSFTFKALNDARYHLFRALIYNSLDVSKYEMDFNDETMEIDVYSKNEEIDEAKKTPLDSETIKQIKDDIKGFPKYQRRGYESFKKEVRERYKITPKQLEDILSGDLTEAKEKKKNPPLNKPKRGGSKKFYVYVRDPRTKKIKKVSFGDTSGLSAKINNPEARRAFSKRHDCPNKKDKTKASYWSCRLPRYAKLLGLKSNFSGFW